MHIIKFTVNNFLTWTHNVNGDWLPVPETEMAFSQDVLLYQLNHNESHFFERRKQTFASKVHNREYVKKNLHMTWTCTFQISILHTYKHVFLHLYNINKDKKDYSSLWEVDCYWSFEDWYLHVSWFKLRSFVLIVTFRFKILFLIFRFIMLQSDLHCDLSPMLR